MAITPILNSFGAGELSPLLDGRTDIQKYYSAAKTLKNFIILPQGGLKRRPGTYYVAEVKTSSKSTRLIPFQFSTTQTYQVEVGDRYMRFYQNRGQILSGASAYEITTPYLEADLFDLQYAQDADTMFITHPSYKPRELSRTVGWDTYTKAMLHMDGADAATTITDEIGKTWTARGTAQIDTAQYKFNGASLLLDGDSDWIDTPDHADFNFADGDFTIRGQFRLNALPADANYFCIYSQETLVAGDNTYLFILNSGGSYSLKYKMVNGGTTLEWTSSAISIATGTWYHIALVRYGTSWKVYFNGTAVISQTSSATHKNYDSVFYVGKYVTTGGYFNGWIDEFRVDKGIARYTENFTPETAAFTSDSVTFTLKNYAPELLTLDVAPGGSGWAAGDTVTGQTSAKTCIIVEVITTTTYRVRNRDGTFTLGEILSNGTNTADQGAANPTFAGDPFGADGSDNCPSAVAIFEQRLFFANSNNDPQKIWGSVSGDFQDMTEGSNAGDAVSYVIGSEQVNAIRWLASGKFLLMGTIGGLFSLSSGSSADPLTPTNVTVKKETSYGSAYIPPKKIGNYFYFIQRNLKTVRETAYSYDDDEYKALDLTILAPHICGDGIVDMAYQQSPYNILWCVRSDGELCALTREIDQEVIAWSRHDTNGSFESVSVIPGDGGDDEVWFIVNRTIDGSTKRYVEYMKPMDFDELEDAFFVDCGLSLDVAFDITGITKASPGVVTTSGAHGFSNGDIVIIRGVSGMTEVNRVKFKVANSAATTFELTDPDDDSNISTSDYTTYVSGGEVRECVTSVTGLTHLEGETVSILADGIVAAEKTVSSGGITLTTPTNGGGELHAGLAFTSEIQTMRFEGGSQVGTSQTKIKRIAKVFFRFFESMGLKAGSPDIQNEVDFGSTEPVELYTGDKEIIHPNDYDKDAYIYAYQDDPIPVTITALVTYLNVYE